MSRSKKKTIEVTGKDRDGKPFKIEVKTKRSSAAKIAQDIFLAVEKRVKHSAGECQEVNWKPSKG